MAMFEVLRKDYSVSIFGRSIVFFYSHKFLFETIHYVYEASCFSSLGLFAAVFQAVGRFVVSKKVRRTLCK